MIKQKIETCKKGQVGNRPTSAQRSTPILAASWWRLTLLYFYLALVSISLVLKGFSDPTNAAEQSISLCLHSQARNPTTFSFFLDTRLPLLLPHQQTSTLIVNRWTIDW